MKKQSRRALVRAAAERYEQGWKIPHHVLAADELAARIEYAFIQGADYQLRSQQRADKRA